MKKQNLMKLLFVVLLVPCLVFFGTDGAFAAPGQDNGQGQEKQLVKNEKGPTNDPYGETTNGNNGKNGFSNDRNGVENGNGSNRDKITPPPVPGQPDPVPGQPDPVPGQPDPVLGQPDPVPATPETSTASDGDDFTISQFMILDEPIPLAPANIDGQDLTEVEELADLGDEEIPLGVAALPKTGELPTQFFYGIGTILTAIGARLRRK